MRRHSRWNRLENESYLLAGGGAQSVMIADDCSSG